MLQDVTELVAASDIDGKDERVLFAAKNTAFRLCLLSSRQGYRLCTLSDKETACIPCRIASELPKEKA